MVQFGKAIIHALLLLAALQVFGLNIAECAAMSGDGSITFDHTLSYVTEHCCFEAKHPSHAGKEKPAGHAHHPHKVCRKIFPGKIMVSARQDMARTEPPSISPLYDGTARGYRFLYFKSFNPPPSRA